jgi:hyperosmotically inducible periplasmic protein
MKTKQGFAFSAVLAAMLLGLVLAGCQKPGPAEQAGKTVDNAVEKVGKQMEKTGDAIEKAAKNDKK